MQQTVWKRKRRKSSGESGGDSLYWTEVIVGDGTTLNGILLLEGYIRYATNATLRSQKVWDEEGRMKEISRPMRL